jgi:hypothetical protein
MGQMDVKGRGSPSRHCTAVPGNSARLEGSGRGRQGNQLWGGGLVQALRTSANTEERRRQRQGASGGGDKGTGRTGEGRQEAASVCWKIRKLRQKYQVVKLVGCQVSQICQEFDPSAKPQYPGLSLTP